jgi:hypothetical protein
MASSSFRDAVLSIKEDYFSLPEEAWKRWLLIGFFSLCGAGIVAHMTCNPWHTVADFRVVATVEGIPAIDEQNFNPDGSSKNKYAHVRIARGPWMLALVQANGRDFIRVRRSNGQTGDFVVDAHRRRRIQSGVYVESFEHDGCGLIRCAYENFSARINLIYREDSQLRLRNELVGIDADYSSKSEESVADLRWRAPGFDGMDSSL